MWPALRSEFLATFGLVLLGTGSIALGWGHGFVALSFGVAVCLMAFLFGAQMNPAASLALCASGRQSWAEGARRAAAQCAGAVCASLLLKAALEPATLGATLPRGGTGPAFAAEALMTFLLLRAAFAAPPAAAPALAGLIVGVEALLGGPISGASMNPARSLGPALVSGQADGLWIYLSAPFLGALAAMPRPVTAAAAGLDKSAAIG
jgi:aquaporin NIP